MLVESRAALGVLVMRYRNPTAFEGLALKSLQAKKSSGKFKINGNLAH
jgi:hypothetical protein